MSVTAEAVSAETACPAGPHSASWPPLLTRKWGAWRVPPSARAPTALTIWTRGTASDWPKDMLPRLAPSYWSRVLTRPGTSPGKSMPV